MKAHRKTPKTCYTASECLEMWALGDCPGVRFAGEARCGQDESGLKTAELVGLAVGRWLELSGNTRRSWAIHVHHNDYLPEWAHQRPGEARVPWLLRIGAVEWGGCPTGTYDHVLAEFTVWLEGNPINILREFEVAG